MVHKYIKRDFTDDIFTTEYLSDEDEYIKFEMFSFDPDYTQSYIVEKGNLTGENITQTFFKDWICFQSSDKVNPMEFTVPYSTDTAGRYRVDILYEKNSNMYTGNDALYFNSNQDLVGWYDVYVTGSKQEHTARVTNIQIPTTANTGAVTVDDAPALVKKATKVVEKLVSENFTRIEDEIKKAVNVAEQNPTRPVTSDELVFEGENNCVKRKTLFFDWDKGDYTFEFAVPHNCFIYGVLIRKELKFYGSNDDEPGSNLMFTKAKFTHSEMGKPSELEVTVGYDDSFECQSSPSGLYMEYMDECNLYVKDNEGIIKRIFGGYVSTPLPDNTREEITIHCADRLKDGVNKYVLDQLMLQNGDSDELEYETTNSISFDKYSEVLRYLCKLYECSLKSNIEGKEWIQEEKSRENGFSVSFGKNKDVKGKQISATNGTVEEHKNSVVLRNGSSGLNKQVWKLYKAKKTPIDITDYNNFHISYGLGNPKTEYKKKETNKVDVAESTAGSQKFGKCGVSADGKYVMAIGTTSSKKDTGKYGEYYKGVFINKCPHCGKAKLVWDSCRSDTNCVTTGNWHGSKRSWGVASIETEITCNGCDSDFSAQGNEKDAPWKKLTKVGAITKSSKAEQTKLHKGEMYAVPNGKDTSVSASDIFSAIKKSVKGFKHSTGTGTTASYLEKHHIGDCWAWSDKISKELKKYKVNHKIVQYVTGSSDAHRSVLYQNSKGKYVDFPYSEYNFPRGTHNTSASKNGRVYYHYKEGGRINQATTTGSTSKSQTTETTITEGFDKDKPFQCYIDIIYSLENSLNAQKYHAYIDFTQKALSDYSMSGLSPVWVNNQSKKIVLQNFIKRIQDYRGENSRIYLQGINLVAPKIKTNAKTTVKGEGANTDWYTNDSSTEDNSSCKMILYSLGFNNDDGSVPDDLNTCGKSVHDVVNDILERAGYSMEMVYGEHRCDDEVHFYLNDAVDPVFTAQEGDNNNILEWSNISYNPANELFNMSKCVFKKNNTDKYFYVESKNAESVLKYQEQCAMLTENEGIGEKEAYWNARHNPDYNPEQVYNFTITVKGCPNVKLGELVRVLAHMKKLNTIKEVDSFVLNYDTGEKPVIQTELGLGELAPDIQIDKTLRELRKSTKQSNEAFGVSALPVTDSSIYEWEN